ncbi:hypothetical protein [Amycolatopsis vastitatis]|uniref:Uncharacterized protein n=1 Tax=Amycolatopsis vastitatis TaxID=1905142 RepID=A0A229T5U7_9PSEU|nr:hypothetical protein [Amycolatopsis vastitatis]OXM66301.1 hypothetical protein CF165_20315 [Amycolatopsis vastitatis]
MNSIDAVVTALKTIDREPVWRAAFERAFTTALVSGIALAISSALGLDATWSAWFTPVVAVLINVLYRLTIRVAAESTSSYTIGWAFRTLLYVGAPSVAFNLVWKLTGPGTVGQALSVGIAAGGLAFLSEFILVGLREAGNVHAREMLSQTAADAVLTETEPATDTEVSSVDFDARLDYRYRRAREEVEVEMRQYLLSLPTNPRTAKRMVNHLSLAMAIAEQRGLFQNTDITRQHLGKWVQFSEQWPALGAVLTAHPECMVHLENAPTQDEVQVILDKWAPGTIASDDMVRQIRSDVRLSEVLDRLVRYDAGQATSG